jgi:hypothetical protein
VKYVIFSDPVTGWASSPIAFIESNEDKMLELKAAGFVPQLIEDDTRPQSKYRRAGGKRGGYCPDRS